MNITKEWLEREKAMFDKMLVDPNTKTSDIEKMLPILTQYQQQKLNEKTNLLAFFTLVLACATFLLYLKPF